MSLSRCRPCLLQRFLCPLKPRCSPFTLSRRLQSSSTRIQIRSLPSPAAQRALDRIEHVLHTLDSRSLVSSAKIQLALRGLQQVDAPVRIGVLGPHCHELLKAFLRPEKEDAQWVDDLTKWIIRHRDNPVAGILLRYGQYVKRSLAEPEAASSGIAILTAPVEMLRTHALELLIVPGAMKPTTNPVFFLPNGRLIDVPVHKAVEYLGSGVVGLGRLLDDASAPDMGHETVKRIVMLDKMDPSDLTPTVRSVKSLEEQTMDGARTWILAGTTSAGVNIKPAVAAFIKDVLRQATQDLAKPELQKNIESPVPTEEIGKAIISWSAGAHASVKSDLDDTGFKSKAWHKIDWWKLLWRVDDVGHVSKYVILEYFLRRTERDAIFLGGRIFQAGVTEHTVGDYMPRDIAHVREEIIEELIPGLQLAAQMTLTRMLEIAGASTGGGILLGFGGFDLVMSGAVAGVGVLGAFAHMRRRWFHEKKKFEDGVRERGRQAIWATEKWAWQQLQAVELAARPEAARAELDELQDQLAKAVAMLDNLSAREGSGTAGGGRAVRDVSFSA